MHAGISPIHFKNLGWLGRSTPVRLVGSPRPKLQGSQPYPRADRQDRSVPAQSTLRQKRALPLGEIVAHIHASQSGFGNDLRRSRRGNLDLHPAQAGLDLRLGVSRERAPEVELVSGSSPERRISEKLAL